MSECITIWTIYKNPDDYPDSWVLRGHDVLPGALQPHQVCFIARTLGEVRAKLPPATLCIGREPDDHPSIHESWVASTDIHEIAGLIDGRRSSARSERSLNPKPLVGALAGQPHQNQIPEPIRERAALLPSGGLSADAEVVPGGKKINSHLEVRLAMISRHVTEGEARVQRIMVAIETRRESGLATELTENLLNTMLVSLSLLIDTKTKIEGALDFRTNE